MKTKMEILSFPLKYGNVDLNVLDGNVSMLGLFDDRGDLLAIIPDETKRLMIKKAIYKLFKQKEVSSHETKS